MQLQLELIIICAICMVMIQYQIQKKPVSYTHLKSTSGNPVISRNLDKIIEKYAELSVQPYLHSLNYAYFYFYEDTSEYVQFIKDAEKLNLVMWELSLIHI